jgi:hypothetical protein
LGETVVTEPPVLENSDVARLTALPEGQFRRCASARDRCGVPEARLALRNLRALKLGFGRNRRYRASLSLGFCFCGSGILPRFLLFPERTRSEWSIVWLSRGVRKSEFKVEIWFAHKQRRSC